VFRFPSASRQLSVVRSVQTNVDSVYTPIQLVVDTPYLEKSSRDVKLTIQSLSGSEVKDNLNLIVVPVNIIGTTTYNP
jgi:hypothetical protein